ncbi:MAG: sulfotransferase [Alphaproteobacteria bacterium HGW-Alphaproteobacteria-16]|nr:MAG: sulfotransferase [Alphaproteobacteria bacterium HGW-Alphaproteobacteria-16]
MSCFIWIASYPKSGNTWTRLMLEQVVGEDQMSGFDPAGFAPVVPSRAGFEQFLHAESGLLTQDAMEALRPALLRQMAAVSPAPYFAKIHDRHGRTAGGEPLFPAELTRATLYLVRDPRDVAISWAHHRAMDIDTSIAFMAQDDARIAAKRTWQPQTRQWLGSWSAHVRGWMTADPAPLVVRYEDLRADPAAVFARICSHCGVDASAAVIAQAIDRTRFDRLQAKEAERGFRMGQADGQRFFRRGEAGGWRDTLTAEQVARIERDHGEVMRELGYLD